MLQGELQELRWAATLVKVCPQAMLVTSLVHICGSLSEYDEGSNDEVSVPEARRYRLAWKFEGVLVPRSRGLGAVCTYTEPLSSSTSPGPPQATTSSRENKDTWIMEFEIFMIED